MRTHLLLAGLLLATLAVAAPIAAAVVEGGSAAAEGRIAGGRDSGIPGGLSPLLYRTNVGRPTIAPGTRGARSRPPAIPPSRHLLGRARRQGGWKQLFDGKDLSGWQHVGPGGMTVENGLIRTHGGMGLLYWTGGKVGDCKLRVVYRMRDENDNSGVFIRIPIQPREEWMPVHYGYEVQIDNHPERSKEDVAHHVTGTLYSLTSALATPGKPGPQWNTMEITLDGPRTIVYLNGVKVTDYSEGQPVAARKFDFEPQRGPRPNEGWLGLQNHSDNDVVFFKEVAIRPLAKEARP